MNAKDLDENLAGAHANGFAESVENLLIDHARTAFREDELRLEAIGQRLDQVKNSARAAQSRLQQRAMLRLERLEARLDRLDAEYTDLLAEIKQQEEDRQVARFLLDRGNADQWSEQEMATAAASANKALIDAAHEIARNKQQIESLLTRRDQLLREQEGYAARENASIELESLLIAGREPQQYEAALANEMISLKASFAGSSEKLNSALTQQRNACLSAESELSVLRAELDEARKRAYELEAARNLEWLARRLDPRNLLWRSEDAIRKDLAEQQRRLNAAKTAVAEHQAQIEELSRQHESQLALLPEAVREILIEKAQREIRDTSTLRAETARQSEEISLKLATQQSELVLLEGRYADEHQRHVSSYFADMLRKAESDLANIETCIAAATQLQLRIEKSRKRHSSLIEKRRVKLETDLQECERQESSQINIIEREAQRLRVRLADRAPRAGMIHDRVTNIFRQQESLPNSTQLVRVSYRLIGDEIPPVASLAVLLHRREETSYVSEHDERLSSLIASILRVDEPAEENRGFFINHFCDIFFGDEQEERTFLISLVSKESNGLLVLVRPSKVLPQLKSALPETMSICVFVRLVYGENRNPENTTLFLLDVALVPDCEARPFERCVALVRHSSRNTLPPASHSLDDLLDQATAHAPVLLDELADRLGDWRGYLSWADEQIFRRAPWAMLGPGELKDSSWEGMIVCESRRTARMFDPESGSPDFRPRFELIQLNAPWRLDGIGTTQLGIRCDRLELIDKDPKTDFLEDCPWGRAAAIAVRLDFKATDSTRLAELAGSAPLALFNVSEVLGSRVQIARYRGALAPCVSLT